MPDHRWKLGYNTLTWNETRDPDLEAVATTIRDAGWEGIELLDPDLGWYGPPSRLRGILQRVGIPAIAVLGVVQIDDARRRRVTEQQKRLIDYAAEVGCEQYVFIGGDRVFRRLPTDDELKRLADVASELAAAARDSGVRRPLPEQGSRGRSRAGVRGHSSLNTSAVRAIAEQCLRATAPEARHVQTLQRQDLGIGRAASSA